MKFIVRVTRYLAHLLRKFPRKRINRDKLASIESKLMPTDNIKRNRLRRGNDPAVHGNELTAFGAGFLSMAAL